MSDFADAFDELEEQQWSRMRELGVPEEDITRAKKHKQWKDDVALYSLIIKQRAWEFDPSCSLVEAYLRLCSALEGLTRRAEAIARLEQGLERCPLSSELILALAKLLFKDDQKEKSLAMCEKVFEMYAEKDNCEMIELDGDNQPRPVSAEDAEDAYYLGGWVKIHDDNHTEAYRIWQDGHVAVPSSELLAIQHRKRFCWDDEFTGVDPRVMHMVGSAPRHRGEPYLLEQDFDAYCCYDAQIPALACPQLADTTIPDGTGESCNGKSTSGKTTKKKVRFMINGQEEVRYPTPALAIFGPEQGRRGVVFRSRHPLLTPEECAHVVDTVNRYHVEQCGGTWGTVRHSSVKTTDVAVESVPLLREWLLALMHTRLCPMLSFLYPQLADGSSLYTKEAAPKCRVRIHDAFIVRYDAEKDKSLSLPEHCDTSAISVVLSLNSQESGHYTGGGTWFEALSKDGLVVDAEVGQAVAFAGPLKHAGFPTTQGVRMILVLFLYVEGFHYGPYLEKARALCVDCCAPAAGGNTAEKAPAGPVGRMQAIAVAAHRPAAGDVNGKPAETEDCSSAGTGECKESSPPSRELLPSGGEKGGFVVYRQTVDLVNMLEKSSIK